MSNKTPIVFLIILLTVIIFCLVIGLVKCLCGGKLEILNISEKNSKVIYEKEFDLNNIENINIKQDVGDVVIKETSNNNIKVIAYGEDDRDIIVDLNDNSLKVDYTKQKKFVFFNFRNFKNDIIIYIPSSYNNEIKIKSDLGNCKIDNLENATLDIDCDAGNVEIEKIKNAKVKCDLGQVEIKEISNKCDIDVDSGNVKIEKLFIQEDSKIKADLGNVDINEINDIYIDANVDLGKLNISSNNRNSDIKLKIECNCGNINIGN